MFPPRTEAPTADKLALCYAPHVDMTTVIEVEVCSHWSYIIYNFHSHSQRHDSFVCINFGGWIIWLKYIYIVIYWIDNNDNNGNWNLNVWRVGSDDANQSFIYSWSGTNCAQFRYRKELCFLEALFVQWFMCRSMCRKYITHRFEFPRNCVVKSSNI